MGTSDSFPHKLRYRHLLIAVSIVFLAFGLRSLTIVQRAASDPSFIPQAGTDQSTYLRNAAGVLAGRWPAKEHYYHPAPSYFFAAIYALLGQSIVQLSFVLA